MYLRPHAARAVLLNLPALHPLRSLTLSATNKPLTLYLLPLAARGRPRASGSARQAAPASTANGAPPPDIPMAAAPPPRSGRLPSAAALLEQVRALERERGELSARLRLADDTVQRQTTQLAALHHHADNEKRRADGLERQLLAYKEQRDGELAAAVEALQQAVLHEAAKARDEAKFKVRLHVHVNQFDSAACKWAAWH